MRRAERRARWTAKARYLLTPALAPNEGGVWADLGCGDGIFTFLLCDLLATDSQVYAVDRDRLALERVTQRAGTLALPRRWRPSTGTSTVPCVCPHWTASCSPTPSISWLTSSRFSILWSRLLNPATGWWWWNTTPVRATTPCPTRWTRGVSLPGPGRGSVGLVQAEIMTRVPSTFLGEMYTGKGLAPGDAPDTH